MRVEPKPGLAAAQHGTTRARAVELQRTPATRSELRAAIKRALVRVEGGEPPEKLVEVLTAHASLETASGDRMFNFNFAGIKGASPAGTTAIARTREVLGGKEVEIKDGFRAYATIDDGALDYVNTMKDRFAGALAPAARGDVGGFAHALKKAGYYTAAESDYARGLAGLMGITTPSAAREDTHLSARSYVPHEVGALSTQSLARVESALDHGRWMDALGASPARGRDASEEDDDS